MKNARPTKAESSVTREGPPNSIQALTPRQGRALFALLRGPVMREALDRIAGASNGPQVISELRDKGLAINCERLERVDRDGRTCRPGLYALVISSRKQARQLLKGPHGEPTR